uniref:SH3 domain containing 19 n=1 Tax=Salarias fasciatus TaxID=181472 RepID=A0A672GI17_SALFA
MFFLFLAKTNSQSDNRDRRRPQITIVSAEPLVSNSWFSGSSLVLPPPQSGWPSVPKPPNRKQAINSVGKASADATTGLPNTENESDSKCNVTQIGKEGSTHTCTRSVTVYWDTPTDSLLFTVAPAESAAASLKPEGSPHPVPRPRTKPQKQIIKEEAADLVKLSGNCDNFQSDAQEVSSNKYLEELLEVFGAESGCEERSDFIDSQAEDAVSEMNNGHSQRNIKARIQAFESQAGTEEDHVYEVIKPQPQPRPRTGINKPPVAAKPSVALKPQLSQSEDDINHNNQNIPNADAPQNSTAVPRPQPPKKPAGFSIKEELETLHSKGALPNGSRHPVLTRANRIDEDDSQPFQPPPPTKAVKEPLKPNLNINNHNSASTFRGVEYGDSPSKSVQPVNNLNVSGHCKKKKVTFCRYISVNQNKSRHTVKKPPPPRPPPAKAGPGRPPAPNLHAIGRSQSAPWETSPAPQVQRSHMKGPVLPPRPNPGHRLYNKYTLQLPHGIASLDYNGSNTGELSFQKNDVLLLLDETDHDHFECQVGETRGRVHKSRLKVITPLDVSPSQVAYPLFIKGPGELGLRAGDVVTMVEQVDSEWYKGTCRGSAGFFPINYVKVLVSFSASLSFLETQSSMQVKEIGPRCVARFDFEGEHSDELSFSEGDVIQLKEYMGQEWARGQIGGTVGIFPLNFVEIVEDLPPAPSHLVKTLKELSIQAFLPPLQEPESSVEWAVAQYDYTGKSDGDLSFKEGDCILITQHVNAEWSCGRLNGREGMFPTSFVKTKAGKNILNNPALARALYSYTSDCDEELSLQVGDIITNLESVDDEWYLGDLRGKRAMVPKNYVQMLV